MKVETKIGLIQKMSKDNEHGTHLASFYASELQQPATDYSSLCQQAIQHLERLTGSGWTDFNTHDPGITILEQFCYALTDLSYRTQYELPDLLSHEGGEAYASIYTPAQILSTRPVTLTDLRKLVIDVPGVRNAWIDIVDEALASFDATEGEVSVATKESVLTASPNVSEIRVSGLLRVWIEKSDAIGAENSQIHRDVVQRLHQCRGLGQDFQAIEVLARQSVGLNAVLEIDAVEDATVLLANVHQSIAAYMSPSVPFHTFDEMLQRGRRMDEIFEGPLLDHGFIDADELAHVERRTTLRISDLIHVLMTVPGVAAVKNLRFLTEDGKPSQDWLLNVDANKTPYFNPRNADVDIQLEKNGVLIDQQDMQAAAIELFTARAQQAESPVQTPTNERDDRPPPGRDRNVANYTSIQQQFPLAYGIGAAGLPQSAPPERKAMAKQLKAYLMFFDQLLANQFAQLANAEKLFSFHDETPDAYFSQAVQDDGTLGLDAIRVSSPEEHSKRLSELTEDPSSEPGDKPDAHRRNRFLDHLLARFGEQFHDTALLPSRGELADGLTPEAQRAGDKRAFLRDYPRIGRDRGVAFNYLESADDENISGLERILHHKLGVTQAEERFYLVEHILLRPIPGDENQNGPLFRGAQASDPYSLQITLVFPQWPPRYNNQALIEQIVREETPAHLTVHIIWMDEPAMSVFTSAHAVWLQRWRRYRRAELDL